MANPLAKTQMALSRVPGYLRTYDIAKDVFREGPEDGKLLTLMNQLGMIETVDDYEFTLNDQDIEPSAVTVLAVDALTKRIIVAAGEGVNIDPYHGLRKSNSVATWVTAVNPDGDNTDEFTLASVDGIAEGDKLMLGAPAYEEGSARPALKSWVPAGRTDYIQTIRLAWGHSRHVQSIKTFVPDLVVQRNRDDAFAYAKRVCERLILFGTKQKLASPTRYMAGGMFEQIVNAGGTTDFDNNEFDYPALVDADKLRTYARGNLTMMVTSNHVIGELTKLFDKQITYNTGSQSFGVESADFRIGSRKYRAVDSHHFQGEYTYQALQLDPKMARLVTTAQANGKKNWFLLQTDAQDPGTDGTINVLTIDIGVRVKNVRGHAVWTQMEKAKL